MNIAFIELPRYDRLWGLSSSLYIAYIQIMTEETRARPYRKRKRAEQEEKTRLRITEAAVELHGTVGPARTKMTDIAGRAGVSRGTIYNHFPTEADLFVACSTHWATNHPYPDPSAWAEIADPSRRLQVALTELYTWYRGTEGMMSNVLRDAPVLAPLGEIMDVFWWRYLEDVVLVLAAAWPSPMCGVEDLQAVLRVVVDFHTWQMLSRGGLEDERTAELVVRMIEGVTGSLRTR